MKKNYLFFIITIIIFSFGLGLLNIKISQATTPAQTGTEQPNVQTGTDNTSSQSSFFLKNPLKAKNVTEVLTDAVDLAIFIGIILAVLSFIFIGFKFVFAQGNGTKLGEAKMWFLYAVIGTAILISSKIIVDVIKNTFIETGVVNKELFK